MEAKHTPSPWRADAHNHVWRTYRNADGLRAHQPIAEIVTVAGHESEAPANTALISAAPDLLAALKELVKAAESEFDTRRCAVGSLRRLNAARAAIARAEGRALTGTPEGEETDDA